MVDDGNKDIIQQCVSSSDRWIDGVSEPYDRAAGEGTGIRRSQLGRFLTLMELVLNNAMVELTGMSPAHITCE